MPVENKAKLVGWVIINHKGALIRMNTVTGKTWALEGGVWLPVKEKPE